MPKASPIPVLRKIPLIRQKIASQRNNGNIRAFSNCNTNQLMPMNKTSTQTEHSMPNNSKAHRESRSRGPQEETLAILRQFARAYFPAGNSSDFSIVLN